MLTRGDQPGKMGHIHHELRSHHLGYLPKSSEVELAGIGRPAGDYQLGFVLVSEPLDLFHVHPVALAADVVRDRVVEPTRDVDLHPVREVPAVIQS